MKKGLKVFFMDGPNACYFRGDSMRHCTVQVRALLKAGLIERYDTVSYSNKHKVRVKP